MFQVAAIPLRYESVTELNAILHHAADTVCHFITPQIKFAFGVYTS